MLNQRPVRAFRSREIRVGSVRVGGDQPIVLQSMTTTDTMDIEATVQQTKDLVNAGCQVVRITAPTVQDAEALKHIKARLVEDGVHVPLVADIHFVPAAALIAADYVEKVRINPGNYADRKMFKTREYSEAEYQEELARIRDKFLPLVRKLKSLDKALRIGTNHGSLSDRIMNRFGDTAKGMVESAIEFAQIARDEDFHNFCFSMKASNVGVMVEAYRLLIDRQLELGWDYPVHLGVTEAGDGEDGRLKSAIGIGALLSEGIGDTIRVSLTEASVKEIPVAEAIARRFPRSQLAEPRGFSLRPSSESMVPPEVWIQTNSISELKTKLSTTKLRPDVILLDATEDVINEIHMVRTQVDSLGGEKRPLLAISVDDLWMKDERLKRRVLSSVDLLASVDSFGEELEGKPVARVLPSRRSLRSETSIDAARSVIAYSYEGSPDDFVVDAALEVGIPFVDLALRGILLQGVDPVRALDVSFGILQATRRRMTKTEYISCPSCGRTLFDLEETTARIKAVTSHLKGVKIAVMGCIVNGPGEMADADFGYVGGAPGRVNLYVGKTCVERNIPSADAPMRLVDLIKKNNRWEELPSES
jgi:(E)-4-hydroxy-3-methylbut-2-enyl-diphosphate synthase